MNTVDTMSAEVATDQYFIFKVISHRSVYESFVVFCKTEEIARNTHPSGVSLKI